MPNTEFDDVIHVVGNTIIVKGPLDDPEDGVRRATVFAFVTQRLDRPDSKAVTVAGEALLYPVDPSPASGPKWWLMCPHPETSMEPPPPSRLPGSGPAPLEQHSYHYDYAESKKWYFVTKMTNGSQLQEGPAFGTAILLTYMCDGSIETYAWSGWLNVEAVSVPGDALP